MAYATESASISPARQATMMENATESLGGSLSRFRAANDRMADALTRFNSEPTELPKKPEPQVGGSPGSRHCIEEQMKEMAKEVERLEQLVDKMRTIL